MAATKQSRQQSGGDMGNPEMPNSAPTFQYGADHSFTLQAIMEMQKSLGSLDSSVKSLSSQVEKQNQPMDDLKKKIGRIEKIMYAAGVLLVVAIAVGGYMIKTATDFAMIYYRASLDNQGKSSIEVTPKKSEK